MPNSINRTRKERYEKEGCLGELMTSFLVGQVLCRERVPVMVNARLRGDVGVRMRKLSSGQKLRTPWRAREHARLEKKKLAHTQLPPSFGFKILKVFLRVLEAGTVEKIADELKRMFDGSNRILLALRLELNDAVQNWSTTELLNSEAYVGLLATNKTLESMKNNGATGSQIRFYEKQALLCRIELSSTLNVNLEKINEVFEGVRNELKHFN